MEHFDINDVLSELRDRIKWYGRGGQSWVARTTKLSRQLVSEVLKEHKKPPARMLKWLGFEKKVVYVAKR